MKVSQITFFSTSRDDSPNLTKQNVSFGMFLALKPHDHWFSIIASVCGALDWSFGYFCKSSERQTTFEKMNSLTQTFPLLLSPIGSQSVCCWFTTISCCFIAVSSSSKTLVLISTWLSFYQLSVLKLWLETQCDDVSSYKVMMCSFTHNWSKC